MEDRNFIGVEDVENIEGFHSYRCKIAKSQNTSFIGIAPTAEMFEVLFFFISKSIYAKLVILVKVTKSVIFYTVDLHTLYLKQIYS